MNDIDTGEVIRSFKSAKNPVAQIKILAELHDATVGEIENILVMQGVTLPEKSLAKKQILLQKMQARKQATEAQNEAIIELMLVGCSMAKIGRKIGVSTATIFSRVRKLRQEKKLPPTRRMSAEARLGKYN